MSSVFRTAAARAPETLTRVALVALVSLVPHAAWAQRTVEGNRIRSTALPVATLAVTPDMQYAGTQTFDLYGVATAEQHFFVERDGSRIKRLLWVQFEGYHPSNTHTYNYSDSTIAHSEQTWHRQRPRAIRAPDTETRPGSDGAQMRAFLRSKGWTMGPDIVLERLVWILDTPARNELMVIYMEDLGSQGLAAADVNEGGKARDRWPELAAAFHARALATFSVVP
jgi:hypothetical protein